MDGRTRLDPLASLEDLKQRHERSVARTREVITGAYQLAREARKMQREAMGSRRGEGDGSGGR
jgi:hypothetical protein